MSFLEQRKIWSPQFQSACIIAYRHYLLIKLYTELSKQKGLELKLYLVSIKNAVIKSYKAVQCNNRH